MNLEELEVKNVQNEVKDNKKMNWKAVRLTPEEDDRLDVVEVEFVVAEVIENVVKDQEQQLKNLMTQY